MTGFISSTTGPMNTLNHPWPITPTAYTTLECGSSMTYNT